MKIARVKVNNRRKAFEITAGRRLYRLSVCEAGGPTHRGR